jgi:hypothetical protein
VKRTRGTEGLVALAQAYEHLVRNEDLTDQDRSILTQVALAVMNNDDPRPQFHIPLEGAPPSPHRHFVCIDFLLQPDAETRSKEAYDRVAESWKLRPRTVREIVNEFRVHAATLIEHSTSREGLARVVEWHRAKHLADNSESSPQT